MRVDTPEHGPHDHQFGQGAPHPAQPEAHDIGLGAEQHLVAEAASAHGLLESVEAHGPVHAGHVEIGQFDHDFHTEHGLHGLDGLHDSVHTSLGLGFAGDEHHTLHDSLHHDPQHPDPHHDVQHDPAHDIGHLFH